MYLDHPTETEERERPERSVRDLAGRIATAPYMEGEALLAEVEIFPHWVPVVDALVDDIGISIRAYGTSELGEAEGREGDIVTALTEGVSVDFVTKPGAGGKVGKLIESAREVREARNTGDWLAAKLHSSFTARADELFGDGYITRRADCVVRRAGRCVGCVQCGRGSERTGPIQS